MKITADFNTYLFNITYLTRLTCNQYQNNLFVMWLFPSIYFELSYKNCIMFHSLTCDLWCVLFCPFLLLQNQKNVKNSFSGQCNCQLYSVHFLITTFWNFEEKELFLKIIFDYKRKNTNYFTTLSYHLSFCVTFMDTKFPALRIECT